MEQQRRVADVVGSELDFVAIFCDARRDGEDPCVGDEDV